MVTNVRFQGAQEGKKNVDSPLSDLALLCPIFHRELTDAKCSTVGALLDI